MSVRKVTVAGAALGATATAIAARQLRKGLQNGHMPPREGRRRVVVAGAGFAGVGTINELAELVDPAETEILLIDRQNYHLFTPLLYQVATGSVDPTNIAYPLRPFCHEHLARYLHAEIKNINLDDQVIETDQGNVTYDYLVLGLGSRTNYFGMQEVEDRAHSLKAISAATQIRRDIVHCVECASRSKDPEERKRLLTFVIVGAGATGVEMVGSMHDLLYNNLLPYYPELKNEKARIILVEATDTILPGLEDKMRQLSLKRFEELGIELMLNTAVSGVREGAVYTKDGGVIPSEMIIWTAGVRANPVAASLDVEKTRDGRIVVDEYLRIPNHPNVFVLGDNAFAHDFQTKKPLPPNASIAVQQGKATGRNIASMIAGGPLHPFHYRNLGEMIALGRGRAAAQLGPVIFGGLPAWLVWRVVYITKLMGIKNRAGVVFDWMTTVFARRDIANVEH